MAKVFFDVRGFNSLAKTNWGMLPAQMYLTHENEEKRKYNHRIFEIERGTFTPLFFSCSGGAGLEVDHFIKHLAKRMSEKRPSHIKKLSV